MQFLLGMDDFPDIIILTETRFKSYHDVSYVPSLESYTLLRKDSITHAGGVGIYIKDHFIYSIRYDLSLNLKDCEDIWIQIDTAESRPILVSAIYRHPRTNLNKFQYALINTLEKIHKFNSKYYICGDININLLKYNQSNAIKHYVDLLNFYDCQNLINKPT